VSLVAVVVFSYKNRLSEQEHHEVSWLAHIFKTGAYSERIIIRINGSRRKTSPIPRLLTN
jgi:hypothetical protein